MNDSGVRSKHEVFVLVSEIRMNHPDKGNRQALSWASVATLTHALPNCRIKYGHATYSQAAASNTVHDGALANMILFVDANFVYTNEGKEHDTAVRSPATDGGDTDQEDQQDKNSEDAEDTPRTSGKRGPKQGSVQRTWQQKIGDRDYEMPPQWTAHSNRSWNDLKRKAELADAQQDPHDVTVTYLRDKLTKLKRVTAFPPKAVSLWQRALGVLPGVGREALVAAAVCMVVATMYALGLGAVFDGGGDDDDDEATQQIIDGIGAAVPCATTLSSFMKIGRLQNQEWLKKALFNIKHVFLATDKGVKGGISHMAKLISFWNREKKTVETFTTDIDGSGASTEECTTATIAALEPLGLGVEGSNAAHEGRISGFSADHGGGGAANESTGTSFISRGLANAGLMIAGCALHALNLLLSSLWPRYYGEGGIENSNALQALHCVFDLQSLFGDEEFSEMWLKANGAEATVPGRMQRPVVTRWWHATAAACQLLKDYGGWIKFCNFVANGEAKTGSNRFDQATKLSGDLRCQSIKCDIVFLSCMAKFFFDKHFKWMQAQDTWSCIYGFRSHRMLVRAYIMASDLEAAAEGVKQGSKMRAFAPWHAALELLPASEQRTGAGAGGAALPSQPQKRQQAARFLADSYVLLDKHMTRWRTTNVACALGDEPKLARALAQALTGEEVDGGQFDSVAHGETIDLATFTEYATKGKDSTLSDFESSFVWREHAEAVAEMAEAEADEPVCLETGDVLTALLTALKCAIERQVLPLMSTTHRVEAAIRDAQLAAAAANRREAARSEVVMERSFFWLRVRAVLLQAARQIGKEHAAKGKVRASALAVKALERADTAGELARQRLRVEQDDSANCTQRRRDAAAAAAAAAYEKQAELVVAGGGRQRAECGAKETSAHTLTIAAAGVEGAHQIKCKSGFNALKVRSELVFRKVVVPAEASNSELKVLLAANCAVPGFPKWFKFTMPMAQQNAHDEAHLCRSMNKTELQEKAQRCGVDKKGLVADILKRVVAKILQEVQGVQQPPLPLPPPQPPLPPLPPQPPLLPQPPQPPQPPPQQDEEGEEEGEGEAGQMVGDKRARSTRPCALTANARLRVQ